MQRRVIRKVTIRLVPFLGLLYLINYLDRVNLGFAALTMNGDLGLSAAAYGLGAGLFFIGYFFFEVPSNIILHRVGARVWIARIMVTWGLVASATAFSAGSGGGWILSRNHPVLDLLVPPRAARQNRRVVLPRRPAVVGDR